MVAVVVTVLATTLLGLRGGIIAAALSTGFLIMVGIAFSSGYLTVGFDLDVYATSPTAWTRRVATIVGFMIVLSTVVGLMQSRLVAMAEESGRHVDALKATLEALQREEEQRKAAEFMLQQSQKMEVAGRLTLRSWPCRGVLRRPSGFPTKRPSYRSLSGSRHWPRCSATLRELGPGRRSSRARARCIKIYSNY